MSYEAWLEAESAAAWEKRKEASSQGWEKSKAAGRDAGHAMEGDAGKAWEATKKEGREIKAVVTH